MITMIGVMIGFYIISKMAHILFSKTEQAHPITFILALITSIVAVYGIYELISASASVSQELLKNQSLFND